MTVSRFAAVLAPLAAASLTAAAVIAVACWLRTRHLAPVADVWAAGFRAGAGH